LVSAHGRIKIIPCGINAKHFGSVTKETARQNLGIAPQSKVILYVGRFDPRKGIETLVKACAKLPQPFQLYLVGGSREGGSDSEEQQRIRSLVKALGLEQVTVFTGQVSQEQLPAYYAAADVCVVPSYYEPFGLVAIEAMAAGTPVIASDVGGLRHTVIHNKTGLLVSPCNPNALAVAIWELFSQPAQRQAYGQAARQWVQSRFSSAAVAGKIQELYQSLTFAESVQEAIQTRTLPSILQQQMQRGLDWKKGLKPMKPSDGAALEKILEILCDGVTGSSDNPINEVNIQVH
jgi:glycosyltransferase involved in cell wall biosynthesis